ncbi:MAG: DUF4197 domain-containing protein [Prevotellaceae bacterium]|jgi:hypothetical protein|nr:DUF4197 domain-containing protein [Prevotellaceae bacterium]
MKKAFLFILLAISLTSCEEVVNSLTKDNTVDGLKEALRVGTSVAVQQLGKENGYLGDEAVKIDLPPEAQTTFQAVKTIQPILSNPLVSSALGALNVQGLDANLENVLITALNRAAEDAAPKSVDIFINTINGMTINDGTNILFSTNNQAATDYLADKTTTELQAAFSPVVNASLNEVSVANYTATEAWATFAEKNNQLAAAIKSAETGINLAGSLGLLSSDQIQKINSVKSVNTDLGGYVTGKALDGLFKKIAGEEFKIRTDASARVNDLLRKVFGQLD